LLLVLQLFVIVGIIVAAREGKGSRDAYFSGAIAATLIGLAFLLNISTPAQLLALSDAERLGAERLNVLVPPIAWIFFALAIGAAIGACVFRTPRVTANGKKTP
jgi:hypothetical protein